MKSICYFLIFLFCSCQTYTSCSKIVPKTSIFDKKLIFNFRPDIVTSFSQPTRLLENEEYEESEDEESEDENESQDEENNDDDDGVLDFLQDYSVKFQACRTFVTLAKEENKEENRKRRLDENEGEIERGQTKIQMQRLVHFRLCPSNQCSSSSQNGCKRSYGDYVVDLTTFLSGYVPAVEYSRKLECGNASNSCSCENNDDGDESEYECKSKCFSKKNLSYCMDALKQELYEGKYGKDIYGISLEDFSGKCERLGSNDSGDNNEELNYFIGPYCSDKGDQIFMGLFVDDTCSVFADNQKGATTYESTVGKDLPYVSSSLVDKQCQNCAWTVNNDDDETNENFIQIYKKAAKCESKMNTNQNSDADCNYIHGLSTLEKRIARKNSKGSFSATLWILFMMMSCFLLASYAYFLLDKIQKRQRKIISMNCF